MPLFEKVLPRHLEIIYQINARFLEDEVEAKWPGDDAKKSELSIIEEGHPKMVRMAYLSVVGSTKVNGVAALHTDLLKKTSSRPSMTCPKQVDQHDKRHHPTSLVARL